MDRFNVRGRTNPNRNRHTQIGTRNSDVNRPQDVLRCHRLPRTDPGRQSSRVGDQQAFVGQTTQFGRHGESIRKPRQALLCSLCAIWMILDRRLGAAVVYDRRTALGISQSELARRAGTTQTVISRLEGGAVTPTLPLLHRLAGALEGELNLKITATSTHAEFPLAS